jgi:viroplasmin and RNaseH domain-containing protein
MTYYVVFEGRVPGVYDEWEDCKQQVHKFSGNCYKGYTTRQEAVAKWRNHQSKNKNENENEMKKKNKNENEMKTLVVLPLLLTIAAVVLYFILV